MQVQDNYKGRYYYDAVGRGFGLLGSVGVEFLLTKRLGLVAQGGGRIVNTSHFTYYDNATQARTVLDVPDGTRPMEVNLSGAYGNLGLRILLRQGDETGGFHPLTTKRLAARRFAGFSR